MHEEDPRILDLRAYPLMTNPDMGWAYSSYVMCPLCHIPFVTLKAPVRMLPSEREGEVEGLFDFRDLVIPAEGHCGSQFEIRLGRRADSTFITHNIIEPCSDE